MATQFELCSYGSFTITNEYGFDLEGEAKDAKGVVEVTIDVGLEGSSRNQIQRWDCDFVCRNKSLWNIVLFSISKTFCLTLSQTITLLLFFDTNPQKN